MTSILFPHTPYASMYEWKWYIEYCLAVFRFTASNSILVFEVLNCLIQDEMIEICTCSNCQCERTSQFQAQRG